MDWEGRGRGLNLLLRLGRSDSYVNNWDEESSSLEVLVDLLLARQKWPLQQSRVVSIVPIDQG